MEKWKYPKKLLLVCLKLIKIEMNFFDCFMYNNEELLLDIRLSILSKYIKKFILVESLVDHQGNAKKNLNIQDLTGAGDLFAAGFLH